MSEAIEKLLECELRKIEQPELKALARSLLVSPRCELREWDYGEVGIRYPCWLVIEHHPSNTGIAYCCEGFGPSYPWGLLFLSGEDMSMGMDGGWFSSIEDALRNCSAWKGQNPPGYEVQ